MKKLALTIAIVLGISLFTYAQTEKSGGLFAYGEENTEEESYGSVWITFDPNTGLSNEGGLFSLYRNPEDVPGLPDHDENGNQDAPLGSGALLLVGLGAAYALRKRSKK